MTRIDEALALARETGEHWSDALLHRLRGEILLKRDAANTAPAEDALLTAIALAQQQKARSFELCAALSLAKLYQSNGQASRCACRARSGARRFFAGAGAQVLIGEAIARALETTHTPTLVNTYWFKASLEVLRGDAAGALRDATRVIELSREHGIGHYLAHGMPYSSWARARLGDRETGSEELREGIAVITASGIKFWVPFVHGGRGRKARRRTSHDAN